MLWHGAPSGGQPDQGARQAGAFNDAGRRIGAPLVIVQWQGGVPVTVYPPEAAFAKPVWPKTA